MQNKQNQRSLLIAREGIPLGVLSEPEVRQLLAAGFLHATDVYRRPEDSEWKRLIEMEQEVKRRADGERFIKRYSGRILATTEWIADKSRVLTAKVKSFVLCRKTVLTEGSQRVLNDYVPQIRKRVAEQLVARPAFAVRSALGNDQLMRKIFGAVYDCLPKPVYRFVPEVVFIEFCLKNKARLFDIDPAQDERKEPSPGPKGLTNQTNESTVRPLL